jgi:hypothetical protein
MIRNAGRLLSESNKSLSAQYSPLLEIGLSNYSHPAPASRSAQIVTPPGLRVSYNTFTETRSPLQNSFIPMPLQHANTVCYVGDFSYRIKVTDITMLLPTDMTIYLIWGNKPLFFNFKVSKLIKADFRRSLVPKMRHETVIPKFYLCVK